MYINEVVFLQSKKRFYVLIFIFSFSCSIGICCIFIVQIVSNLRSESTFVAPREARKKNDSMLLGCIRVYARSGCTSLKLLTFASFSSLAV